MSKFRIAGDDVVGTRNLLFLAANDVQSDHFGNVGIAMGFGLLGVGRVRPVAGPKNPHVPTTQVKVEAEMFGEIEGGLVGDGSGKF